MLLPAPVPTLRSTTTAFEAASAVLRNGSGSALHQLSERRTQFRGRSRRRSGKKEKGPDLGFGEAAQVGAPASGKPPPAVSPPRRVDGEARHAESLEVAPRRALGDLELGGRLRSRHLCRGAEGARSIATSRSSAHAQIFSFK